jgi:hypothetical protein
MANRRNGSRVFHNVLHKITNDILLSLFSVLKNRYNETGTGENHPYGNTAQL